MIELVLAASATLGDRVRMRLRSVLISSCVFTALGGCALLPLFEGPEDGGSGGSGGGPGTGASAPQGGGGEGAHDVGGGGQSANDWVTGVSASQVVTVRFEDVDLASNSSQIVVVGTATVVGDKSVPADVDIDIPGCDLIQTLNPGSYLIVAFYSPSGDCEEAATFKVETEDGMIPGPISVAHLAKDRAIVTARSVYIIDNTSITRAVDCTTQTCYAYDVAHAGGAIYAVGRMPTAGVPSEICSGLESSTTGAMVIAFTDTGKGAKGGVIECTAAPLNHGPMQGGSIVLDHVAGSSEPVVIGYANGPLVSPPGTTICENCVFTESLSDSDQPKEWLGPKRTTCPVPHIAVRDDTIRSLTAGCVATNNQLLVSNGSGGDILVDNLIEVAVHDLVSNDNSHRRWDSNDFIVGVGAFKPTTESPHAGFIYRFSWELGEKGARFNVTAEADDTPQPLELVGAALLDGDIIAVGNYASIEKPAIVIKDGALSTTELPSELESCDSSEPCRPFLMRWSPP